MGEKKPSKKAVLVAVLKRKRDLSLLLKERWYHMPVERAPRQNFRYLAFYGPASLGREGKRIRYYARVTKSLLKKRRDIFPGETGPPRAEESYRQIFFGRIQKLPRPIRNIPPRRVSFGFTTLKLLKNSKNILELYAVFPAEEIVGRALKRAGIPAVPQYRVEAEGRKYRLDFAILCKRDGVAVECDNLKAHSGKVQRRRDGIKDKFLKRRGWTVIRLKEPAIRSDLENCIARIRRAAFRRGGAAPVLHFR